MAPERGSGWLGSTFNSLDNTSFRILSVGSFLAFVGFMMSSTAQNVVAFDITGNNRAVGLVTFGQGIAMLFLAPFGGALADRLSKRLVLLVCQSMIGLTFLSVAILLATDQITIFFLAASAFITGTMFSLLGPARQALVGELIEPNRRGNAAALTQVALNSARVAGPLLGSALLAWSLFGATGTFFVAAAVFVVVVATLSLLPPTQRQDTGGRSVLADVALGIKYVRENPQLLPLVLGFILVVTMGFPYFTVLPGYANQELGVGAAGYGIMVGVSAMGGLVMSLLVAPLADSSKARFFLVLNTIGIGVALILTGLAPSFAIALITMFGVGAATSGFQTLNSALVLREANPAYYGRVMSLMMLAWGFAGVAGLPVGVLADAIGERGALIGMGTAVCIAIALLTAWGARLSSRREYVAGATLAAREGGAGGR
ncbi:MAG: MFS transporter [Dehalococcoidia bacterium]